MPQYNPEDRIWSRVLELAQACQGEGNSFATVLPFTSVDPARPLYVLVHPGDVVQTRSDVYGHPNAQAILAYSSDRQTEMGDDVERLVAAGWDVAVLHRFSSSYGFGTSNTVEWFEEAVDEIHERGAVLFGDDLAEAAEWLLGSAQAAARPLVLLSGAWSCADHGCVTMIGTLMETAGARVHLAASACVSPDGSGAEWRPAVGVLCSVEAAAISRGVSPSPRP
jgi:hypothetical protein